MFREFLF